MSARTGGAIALATVLGCSHAAPGAPPRAVGRAGASHRSAGAAGGRLLGEYVVDYDGRGELRIEAQLDRAGSVFSVEAGADAFVEAVEVGGPGGSWARAAKRGRAFAAPACATGACRIRYRYALRNASKRLDDLDVASEEGEVLEAPPSTWLLAPEEPPADARIRFRVHSPERTTFVTGIFRSHEADADGIDAWDIALGDLWTAPYSAFGPLRILPVAVPAERDRPAATIEVALAPGKLSVTDDDITAWTQGAAKAVAGYMDGFPMAEALVLVVPARGRWVGEGKTLSGGGGAIFMRVGEHAQLQTFHDDWVLVHEMTHLSFPSVPRENDWAEEGLATYVEPFARARTGLMTVEDAWRSLVDGLPNGLPAAGDRGLDRTPTWGRTYWGGALFYLLADIEIHKRTQNRFGLEHALRGILAAGGNNAHRWSLDDAFAAGDAAIGVPVLRELHRAMGASPHPVDLEALWRDLGVHRTRGSVQLDDGAPLAAVRRALTTPS